MGARRIKIRMYVLCLLKFKDDKVVIPKELLDIFATEIGSLTGWIQSKETDPKPGAEYCVFHILPERVTQSIQKGTEEDIGKSFSLQSARLGYYHHRFIVDFQLRCPEKAIRVLRESLTDFSKEMIDECVGKMNEYVGKMTDGSAMIWDYLTYPLVLLENSGDLTRPKAMPFSFQTTSLCFDIYKPAFFGLWAKKYMIRISIPGMFVLGNLTAEKESVLIRDLINSCYQYGLYSLKDRYPSDGPPTERGKSKLNEKDLINLWSHIIDTMGGKTSDIQVARMARVTYAVCFFTLVVSFLMFLYPMMEKTFSEKGKTGQPEVLLEVAPVKSLSKLPVNGSVQRHDDPPPEQNPKNSPQKTR